MLVLCATNVDEAEQKKQRCTLNAPFLVVLTPIASSVSDTLDVKIFEEGYIYKSCSRELKRCNSWKRSQRNECRGVQNPHRYMHAYNVAGEVSHGSLCILFNARSIELHAPEQGCGTTKLVHTLHLNRVLELAVFLRVSDLRVGGRHLALPPYKLKPSVT